MSAMVLSFPSPVICPCCGRPCSDEDLSACYTCGEKFCGSAKSNCKSICACDRLAGYLAALQQGPSLFTRLWRALPFVILLLVFGCSKPAESVESIGAALDSKLTDAYMRKDWPALAAIVAPDYYASGDGFEWDYAALQREFPKIQLVDFHVEHRRVKQLAPGVILVSDVAMVRETYGAQDISGRYWSSDVWVKREGQWRLLVEQEYPAR